MQFTLSVGFCPLANTWYRSVSSVGSLGGPSPRNHATVERLTVLGNRMPVGSVG